MYPLTSNPTRPTQSSPPRNDRWNSSLSPTKRGGDICLPRPDPSDPKPGNPSHMPPRCGTHTLLPDPTIRRPVWRSPDPTPSETPLHFFTGDSRPNVTARPCHTSVRYTTRWPYIGNPNPEAGYPTPATYPIPPREPAGIGTTHEVAATIMITGSLAIHESMHLGRGYTSS